LLAVKKIAHVKGYLVAKVGNVMRLPDFDSFSELFLYRVFQRLDDLKLAHIDGHLVGSGYLRLDLCYDAVLATELIQAARRRLLIFRFLLLRYYRRAS